MSQWKGKHEEQARAVQRGLRYMWPPKVSEQWEEEYDLAVYERGQEAKRAAIARGELPEEVNYDD